MRSFEILGRSILIANVGGRFYAMDGICSHGMGVLDRGVLNGHVVKCPIHGAEFDLRTGKVINGPWKPPYEIDDLRTYAVGVEDRCLTLDYQP